MGKLNEPGFSGRVGPVVHYTLNGKSVMRSLPRKYKQSKATKVSASDFGRASGIAASIRSQMNSIIPYPKDNGMQTQLISAVFEWIRSIRQNPPKINDHAMPLEGFNFFEKSIKTVRERGFPEIEVSNPSSGVIQIKIPSFIPNARIKAPAHTKNILCKIATGVTDLKNNLSLGDASAELQIEYNGTKIQDQTISFKIPTFKNVLIVTGASLTYKVTSNGKIQENKNKAFMPVEILSAICL